MLATINRPQFVSRIFTDRFGRDFRLTFFVSIVDGELKGRLVAAEPVSRENRPLLDGSTESFFLPFECPKPVAATEYVAAFVPIVSPYFSQIYLVSQPTRAPSNK